jgi:arginine N-succinyltransferase
VRDQDPGRFVLRAAKRADLDSYVSLARATGGGFTTLPADEAVLAPRLAKTEAAFAADIQQPGGEDYVFVLDDMDSGNIAGTSAIYSKLGSSWPFYSFRVSELNRHSPSLSKVVRNKILLLTSDFDACTEVGGLFLLNQFRGTMAGRLLSLGRFLFMADHRPRFADHVVAELRGRVRPDNSSAFWDAVGQHFFDLPFQEADLFGAINGNQFIADLIPSHPIYVNMLPAEAREVIGVAHIEGGGALRLLMQQGFVDDGYVDIFDAGPTVHCPTGTIHAIRESQSTVVCAVNADNSAVDTELAMIATGIAADFRCTIGDITRNSDGEITIDAASAEALDLGIGYLVRVLAV